MYLSFSSQFLLFCKKQFCLKTNLTKTLYEKKNIFCTGIPETGENMVKLDHMLYLDMHGVYYNDVI